MENRQDKLSAFEQTNLLKATYSFQIKDRRVKVVFSANSHAPTMENALVKIATEKAG